MGRRDGYAIVLSRGGVIRPVFALNDVHRRLHVGELGKLEFLDEVRLGFTHRPHDSAVNEVVILVSVPAAVVVTGGGIKDAALAIRANPGPGFLLTLLEHDPVFIVLLVNVGFVPGFENVGITLHDRVFVVHFVNLEHTRAMRLELRAQQFDELFRIAEAAAGGM